MSPLASILPIAVFILLFYNQTRGLRLFTPINDETLVRKYVETLLRRTFGTPDAMKLAVRQTAQS